MNSEGQWKNVRLLIHGLQRSGTNYLETLLKNNYRIKVINDKKNRSAPLHKHFRIYDEKNIIPENQYKNDVKINNYEDFAHYFRVKPSWHLIISKNPYNWLVSYRKWANKCNWPEVPHHYIEEYNLFYGKWIDLNKSTNNIIFIRYFDLIKDYRKELKRLEVRMELKKRLFKKTSTNIRRVQQSDNFTNEKLEYILKEGYMNELEKKDIEIVNKIISPKVISFLGYDYKY